MTRNEVLNVINELRVKTDNDSISPSYLADVLTKILEVDINETEIINQGDLSVELNKTGTLVSVLIRLTNAGNVIGQKQSVNVPEKFRPLVHFEHDVFGIDSSGNLTFLVDRVDSEGYFILSFAYDTSINRVPKTY